MRHIKRRRKQGRMREQTTRIIWKRAKKVATDIIEIGRKATDSAGKVTAHI
jgi:hypothetical protein